MQSNISGHTFIKKRRKTGVGGGRAWGWWGRGERGPLLLEGGLDSFDDILGRGSEPFHQSSRKMYHKHSITPTISDYFLLN